MIDSESIVYFVQNSHNGLIKIGCTKNKKSRLSALGVTSDGPIRCLATMPGGLDEERKVHRLFSGSRVQGEWFSCSPELLSFISNLSSSNCSPDNEKNSRSDSRNSGRITLRQAGAFLSLDPKFVKGVADAMDIALTKVGASLVMSSKDFDRLESRLETMKIARRPLKID